VQAPVSPAAQQRTPGRLPAGFRWIAVRPGPPPPARRRPRPLGPTPRYRSIPRWGLVDQIAPPAVAGQKTKLKTASNDAVRAVLMAATAVFAVASAAHLLRYLLLLVNRTVLLPPWVAFPGRLMGVLASLAAIVAVLVVTVVMTAWLVDRRAAAYRQYGRDDPRPEWTLWAGCVIPLVSLFWAPVFLIELAHAEGVEEKQRKPIIAWWVAWAFATVVAVWGTWTRRATEPQAIADNTITMIVAYLAGTATLVLLWRVFDGFVGRPAQRPRHRWVVVSELPAAAQEPGVPGVQDVRAEAGDDAADDDGALPAVEVSEESSGESDRVVESGDREPAA
jgi:hypothetical protein